MRKAVEFGDISLWEPCGWGRKLAYTSCFVISLAAVIVVILRAFGCFGTIPISDEFMWLSDLVSQEAMFELISTVGTTTVVIAWLINVTRYEVCNVRIGTLVKWAYPGFFQYYLFIYLPTFFTGIYVGKGSAQRLPTLMILISLGIGVVFIGWVCFVFVFNPKAQERIAYTYYRQQLRCVNKIDEDCRYELERIMTCIADHVAQIEAKGGRLRHKTIFALWSVMIGRIQGKSNGGSSNHELDLDCCAKAERFWDTVSSAQKISPPKIEFLTYLIEKGGTKDGTKDGTEGGTEGGTEDATNEDTADHLLVGLLLKWKRQHRVEDVEWAEACDLLFENAIRDRIQADDDPPAGLRKLLFGLAWVMVVESAFYVEADFIKLQELALRIKLDGQEESKDVERFLGRLRDIFCREFGYEQGIYTRMGRRSFLDVVADHFVDMFDTMAEGDDPNMVIARYGLGVPKRERSVSTV